jgi:hypothetical protein
MGDAKTVDIEVHWPMGAKTAGTVDRVDGVKAGRLTIEEGLGRVSEAKAAPVGSCLDAFLPERRPETMGALAEESGGAQSADALYYAVYSAMDRRDPSACAVAKPFRYEISNGPGNPRSVTGEWLCKSYYTYTNYFRNFIADASGDEFAAACRDWYRFEAPAMKPEELKQVCRIIAANRNDPAAVCDQPQGVAFRRYERELISCKRDHAAFSGDPAGCDGFNWNPVPGRGIDDETQQFRERCTGLALWRAEKKGDFSSCSKLDACRALTGESSALAERYRLKLAAAACRADSRAASK